MRASPLSSSLKNRWKEQNKLGLCAAFVTGYFGHLFINLYKRREHWLKVNKMYDESNKRSDELNAKSLQYHRATMDALRRNRKSTS